MWILILCIEADEYFDGNNKVCAVQKDLIFHFGILFHENKLIEASLIYDKATNVVIRLTDGVSLAGSLNYHSLKNLVCSSGN
jgi:hypothetical protein